MIALTGTAAVRPLRQPQRTSRPLPVPVVCRALEDSAAPGPESRRALLSKVALGAASGVLAAGAPAQPAAALPGFKKDLTPRNRRLQIPESAFSEGPEGIKFYDTVVGDGDEAVFGDRVAAHVDVKLRGVTISTTRQGMGVTGGSPLGFDVGAKPGQGGTLKGLDLGIRGMHVGGQRRLLVPPALAYGSKGTGEIPPGATLTIDVALLSIKTSPFGSRVKLVEG